MTKKNIAQSVIEYSVLIIVVALAIIAMNRYVLRGVWAGFKMWEEQVHGSLEVPVEESCKPCRNCEGVQFNPGDNSFACRFEGSACPQGWEQVDKWSATVANSDCCTDVWWCGEDKRCCKTPYHQFKNQDWAVEGCQCFKEVGLGCDKWWEAPVFSRVVEVGCKPQ